MPEETSTTSGDKPPTTAQENKLNLLSIFKFLKDNFVVGSGLAVLLGLVFSNDIFIGLCMGLRLAPHLVRPVRGRSNLRFDSSGRYRWLTFAPIPCVP